ncbi:MAG: hypothetical protein HYS17_06560 [Micavibrio aeruginosavorus]|uniref:Uncharacterized protein n=1 Tax=Micavibrio aeruginosavorus TaxID=349221 RepID=A0A7T5UGR3_9BACT|nr:MAG: hypothetical protein HYS17_06560 [Micavibrio aeruginosavorus]
MPNKAVGNKAAVAALVITGAAIGASVVPLVHVLFKESAKEATTRHVTPAPAASSPAPKP